MFLYQCVARLPRVTTIPGDAVEVVTHWLDSTNSAPDNDNLLAMWSAEEAFWLDDTDQTHAICAYLATCIDRTAFAASFTFYGTTDLSGETPFGPPITTLPLSLSGPSGTGDFPAEVAVCLSFHGDLTGIVESQTNPSPPPATIRPAARRRGRSYIGPLMGGVSSTIDANNEVMVSSTIQDDLAVAASRKRAAGAIDFNWVVWSKADEAAYEIVGGFINDTFDTQRRRGNEAVARTTWT